MPTLTIVSQKAINAESVPSPVMANTTAKELRVPKIR
jgi:hypothetical protein